MSKILQAPTANQLLNPVFQALKKLGGSGSNDEINDKVIEILKLSDRVLNIPQKGHEPKSQVVYNIEWARTYLKKYGVINNTKRGIWSVNNEFDKVNIIDEKEVMDKIRTKQNIKKGGKIVDADEKINEQDEIRNKLHNKLMNMDPYDFEKLSATLLRESGFTKLEVTKKSGDGGIDGYGYLKVNNLISFKIVFQCKRYTNNVPAKDIRDFRGSMESDIKNGIFITTSDFTKDAKNEAVAKGKQHIDLINGEKLLDKLIELNLGIKQDFIIDETFFSNI